MTMQKRLKEILADNYQLPRVPDGVLSRNVCAPDAMESDGKPIAPTTGLAYQVLLEAFPEVAALDGSSAHFMTI